LSLSLPKVYVKTNMGRIWFLYFTTNCYNSLIFVLKLFLLNQVCSSFEESKSFMFDGRLDVLVVAEVLENRIWGRLYL